MTIKKVTAITWTCDIPGCKDTLTAYGDDYATNNGWLVREPILDSFRDLCPDHYRELKVFLDDNTDS